MTEVHWRIIANLGFKFHPTLPRIAAAMLLAGGSSRAMLGLLSVVDMLIVGVDNVEWASETPKSLWKKIIEEVQTYFGYRLDW